MSATQVMPLALPFFHDRPAHLVNEPCARLPRSSRIRQHIANQIKELCACFAT